MKLTSDQVDILTELVTIGVGKAACSLSDMIDCRVDLDVPKVDIGTWPDGAFAKADGQAVSMVAQRFTGDIRGTAALALPHTSARALVGLLTMAPDDSVQMDAERESVITEVGNIIINAILGSLGNLTALDITFDLPRYCESADIPMLMTQDQRSVLVGVVFAIKDRAVEGSLGIVFDLPSYSAVWGFLDPGATDYEAGLR